MSRAESWAKVKGPLAAVWMSLRRIGWSMTSAHEIVTDSNTFFSLQVAPRDFRDLLEQGLHRWQLRKVQERISELQDEQIWLKGLRACVAGSRAVRRSADLGAL
eukprot:427118-Pyramimonas_sp.AAC.1